MKKLIVGALLVAAAGFGCQRTYEDRSAGYRETRTETAQADTSRGVEYGEEGQQQDVNLSQDMVVEEEEAFGGSGSAGMTDESGYGGAGDAGMGMAHHGMHHMDGGMMMHSMDAGMMMGGMGMDAGMMMGADAGMKPMKKKAK